MAEHECHSRAKRRDLRERQIDKDHFASKHLDSEISMDADKRDRHQERRPEKNERLDHHLAAADVRASTFASNSEMYSPVRGNASTDAASVTTDAPALLATKATSRSGSCGSRTTIRTPRARMVWTIPARCEGLGGTPGLVSINPTKSSRNRRAK